MLFIKTDDLKAGARLAKPIFNKNGVLLYDRDTKLTEQGISSVKKFGLIGLYILEPAEPLPPLTEEDREFERFQTMTVSQIKDTIEDIINGRKTKSLFRLCQSIIKNYGNLDNKIHFFQNLRSPEDYYYKHALNVSILTALISNKMQIDAQQQLEIVMAALVYNVERVKLDFELAIKEGPYSKEEQEIIRKNRTKAISDIETNNETTYETKKMILQVYRGMDALYNKDIDRFPKVIQDANIILAAEYFDTLTAMQLKKEPVSEIQAVRTMLNLPEAFSEETVKGLLKSIYILPPGLSVELSNGEKGLILSENKSDIQRPMILGFDNNRIYDLNNDDVYKKIKVKDVMKTMDNRFIIDRKVLREYLEKNEK